MALQLEHLFVLQVQQVWEPREQAQAPDALEWSVQVQEQEQELEVLELVPAWEQQQLALVLLLASVLELGLQQ